MKQSTFSSDFDGLDVTYYAWPIEIPAATVVIAHGLGEHAKRYDRFANALNKARYGVYALDHRGHGQSMVEDKGPGDLGSGGWNALCADVVTLMSRVLALHPNVPQVLFGHSMGSFAAQQIVQDHSEEIDALILSGSTAYDKLVEAVLSAAAAGGDAGFNYLNSFFEPARTESDWLSRDETEVDIYVADPLCGFDFTEESNISAATESPRLSDPSMIARIRPDLPVLFMAGEQDPLNDNLKRLRLLEKRWRQAGIKQIDTQYYEGGRHEMLNEINRDEVTRGLIRWISANIVA